MAYKESGRSTSLGDKEQGALRDAVREIQEARKLDDLSAVKSRLERISSLLSTVQA